MKFSQIKTLKTFCANLDSTPDFREVLAQIELNQDDFEVDNVRFILASEIDQIQANELTGDLYCLGCFTASFIAEQANWPIELVQAAQDGEAF